MKIVIRTFIIAFLLIATISVVAGNDCEVYCNNNIIVVTGNPDGFVETINDLSLETTINEIILWEANGYYSVIIGLGNESYNEMPKIEMENWAFNLSSL